MLNRKDLYLLAEAIKRAADRLGDIYRDDAEFTAEDICLRLSDDSITRMHKILEGDK